MDEVQEVAGINKGCVEYYKSVFLLMELVKVNAVAVFDEDVLVRLNLHFRLQY
jgi:hypothetical protein